MFAYLNLFGDGVHNFVDGVMIVAGFLIDIPLGVATTLAVIFHEILQEIGDFGADKGYNHRNPEEAQEIPTTDSGATKRAL